MNLIWRFIWVWFYSKFASQVDFFAETKISLRVLPTDIDIMGHMNNGRYMSLMDLSRINYMMRCGMFRKLTKAKIYPVVASAMIRFKKSLMLFQSFQLTTQVLGWDDKFFYIAHTFIADHEIYSVSVIKARFLIKEKGGISPQALMEVAGLANVQSPKLPEWLTAWNGSEKQFNDLIQKR